MKGGITQDNPTFFTLPKEPLKGGIRDIGRGTVPPHHQAILVHQQTEFAPDNPPMVGQTFATDLLRAASFAHRVDQLDPRGVHDAAHRRSS